MTFHASVYVWVSRVTRRPCFDVMLKVNQRAVTPVWKSMVCEPVTLRRSVASRRRECQDMWCKPGWENACACVWQVFHVCCVYEQVQNPACSTSATALDASTVRLCLYLYNVRCVHAVTLLVDMLVIFKCRLRLWPLQKHSPSLAHLILKLSFLASCDTI